MHLSTTLRKVAGFTALAAISALVLSACSSSGGSTSGSSNTGSSHTSSGSPTSTTKVNLRLDFVHTAKDAIWTYGIDQGIFKAAGIDLSIGDGKGSATTAQTVSNNSDDFGLVDAGTWLTGASKGLQGKAIMTTVDGGSFAILSTTKNPITSLTQLAGKSVAITAGDAPSTLLPAVLKKAGVDASKVREVNMQAASKLTALSTGRVDSVATSTLVQATLAATGTQTTAVTYASVGVNTPGWYLVASPKMLADPDLTARFVAAAQKAIAATLANPTAAVASFVKHFPDQKLSTATSAFGIIQPLIRTSDLMSKPIGYVSPTAAEFTSSVLAQYGSYKTAAGPVTNYYTNEFIK